MAGGKETPRQKMIGMMYLVLTALLALNVSKSILDAFVNIEENTQITNLTDYKRGDKAKRAMKLKLKDDDGNTNPKAQALYRVMNSIDSLTAEKIRIIDNIKIRILQDIGEKNLLTNPDKEKGPVLIPIKGVKVDIKESTTTSDKTKQTTTGVVDWPGKNNEQNPVKYWLKPIRMNLDVVSSKDSYDQPMLLLGVNNPEALDKNAAGWTIWPNYNDFRGKLMSLICDASSAYDDGKPYKFVDPKINKFEDQEDLDEKIQKAIAKMTLSKSDVFKIAEIYKKLTLSEMLPDPAHGPKAEVHWMMKTFDHAPAVAAMASLTSLQSKILTARGDALAHLNAKIEGGKFSFTQVTPMVIVSGTPIGGSTDTVKVFMAAFDDQNQPDVTIDGGNGEVIKTEGGIATVVYKAPGSGSAKLKGQISIMGKEGKSTADWEREIPVVEESSSIASPQLQVLYAGYPNIIVPSMAGGTVKDLRVSGAGATRRKGSGDTWIVNVPRPTNTRVKISFVGEANGVSKTTKPFEYKVLAAPVPRVLTENGPKSGIAVLCGLELSNPLGSIMEFKCIGGTVSYGSTRKNFSGNFIPSSALRGAPRGSFISVSARAKNVKTGKTLTMPRASIKID